MMMIMMKSRFYRTFLSSLLVPFLVILIPRVVSEQAFSPTSSTMMTTTTSTTVPTTLITFDVDGTLVQGSGNAARDGAHAQAFNYALRKVLGGTKNDGSRDRESTIIPNVADVLPRHLYHGSTDGLILIRYAQAAIGISPEESGSQLDLLMDVMYEYIMTLDDTDVSYCLSPLPGVIETLKLLTIRQKSHNDIMCGLVTGNVEGIARRKMKAVGIYQTGIFHGPCTTQKKWSGTEEIGFLGGFGSDYCSKDIHDLNRNYLDRAEQIKIAAARCQTILLQEQQQQQQREATSPTTKQKKVLSRVVHVGDAPSDVLAAKILAESNPGYCVGMVAVATGSYSSQELRELCGTPIPGQWEPIVLEDGMKDPYTFLKACGIQ